jgi:hypothetical protein
MKDLFEQYETLPQEVKVILAKFQKSENDYKDCQLLVEELNEVGYICEFGLDAIPFNLSVLNSFSGEKTMKTTDDVIEALSKDNECSKYMLDWVLNRIYDIERNQTDWELKKIEAGYRLSYDLYSFDYFYISFI